MKDYLQVILLAALAVLVGGCSTEFMQSVKSAATEMTTPAPVLGPYDAPQPSPWAPQPHEPVSPTPPPPAVATTPAPTPVYTAPKGMVEQPHRFNEPKVVVVQPASVVALASTTPTPSAPPGKGASRLMAKGDASALQVNAREITPSQPTTPAQAETTSTTFATAPVGELVFKGPPREYHSSNPTNWIVLGGLLILAVAGGGFAWYQIQHRAVVVAASPKKEKAPEGFEMREPTDVPDPVGHGPDTVLDA